MNNAISLSMMSAWETLTSTDISNGYITVSANSSGRMSAGLAVFIGNPSGGVRENEQGNSGSVNITMAAAFDMAAGMADFVGAGRGLRETEGTETSGGATLTNTISGAVLSSDTAIYWASQRSSGGGGGSTPVITPGSGSATTLQYGTSTNSNSVLADQSMPGGSLAVANVFTSIVACNAVQVIVEVALVVNTARSTAFIFA